MLFNSFKIWSRWSNQSVVKWNSIATQVRLVVMKLSQKVCGETVAGKLIVWKNINVLLGHPHAKTPRAQSPIRQQTATQEPERLSHPLFKSFLFQRLNRNGVSEVNSDTSCADQSILFPFSSISALLVQHKKRRHALTKQEKWRCTVAGTLTKWDSIPVRRCIRERFGTTWFCWLSLGHAADVPIESTKTDQQQRSLHVGNSARWLSESFSGACRKNAIIACTPVFSTSVQGAMWFMLNHTRLRYKSKRDRDKTRRRHKKPHTKKVPLISRFGEQNSNVLSTDKSTFFLLKHVAVLTKRDQHKKKETLRPLTNKHKRFSDRFRGNHAGPRTTMYVLSREKRLICREEQYLERFLRRKTKFSPGNKMERKANILTLRESPSGTRNAFTETSEKGIVSCSADCSFFYFLGKRASQRDCARCESLVLRR